MSQEFQYPPDYRRDLDTPPPPKQSFEARFAAELKEQFGVTRLGLYKAWVKIDEWSNRLFVGFIGGFVIGIGAMFAAAVTFGNDEINGFMAFAAGYLIALVLLLFIAKMILIAFIPAELLLRKEDGIVELEEVWTQRPHREKRSRNNRNLEPVGQG